MNWLHRLPSTPLLWSLASRRWWPVKLASWRCHGDQHQLTACSMSLKGSHYSCYDQPPAYGVPPISGGRRATIIKLPCSAGNIDQSLSTIWSRWSEGLNRERDRKTASAKFTRNWEFHFKHPARFRISTGMQLFQHDSIYPNYIYQDRVPFFDFISIQKNLFLKSPRSKTQHQKSPPNAAALSYQNNENRWASRGILSSGNLATKASMYICFALRFERFLLI